MRVSDAAGRSRGTTLILSVCFAEEQYNRSNYLIGRKTQTGEYLKTQVFLRHDFKMENKLSVVRDIWLINNPHRYPSKPYTGTAVYKMIRRRISAAILQKNKVVALPRPCNIPDNVLFRYKKGHKKLSSLIK